MSMPIINNDRNTTTLITGDNDVLKVTTTTPPAASAPAAASSLSSTITAQQQQEEQEQAAAAALIKIPLQCHNNNIIDDKLNNKELYIFLDYDGTLTPIVSNPMDAKLSPQMGDVLKELSLKHKVSIVTGRSMNTIRSFIKPLIGEDAINRIQFAASHGFDIMGPKHTHYQVGGAYLPQLTKCRDDLIIACKKYPNCVVEDNKFSVSVHYRNVDPDLYLDVSNMVHNIIGNYPQLKVHYGKMVYEIKLDLNWNKGQAVLWLLNAYGVHNNDGINDQDGDDDDGDIIPIYIGDDITDEDAFRAIKQAFPNNGMGILVHNTEHELGRPTAATYTLEDTNEVREFLKIIANMNEKEDKTRRDNNDDNKDDDDDCNNNNRELSDSTTTTITPPPPPSTSHL